MNLNDFSNFQPLENVIKKINAEEKKFDLEIKFEEIELNKSEKWNLINNDNLDINAEDIYDQITLNEDGTLGLKDYKNARVILYIKDSQNAKFHITYCGTLEGKISRGGSHRYAITRRTDGYFKIISRKSHEGDLKKLDVCKNCLNSLGINHKKNKEIIENFPIKDFFEKGKSALTLNIDVDNFKFERRFY